MNETVTHPVPVRRRTLGLSFPVMLGLAALTLPRVVLHDLGLVHEGTFVNLLLVFVPLAIWIVTVLVARVPNPFLTLLVTGLVSGVLLVVTHQLLWDVAFADVTLQLGGSLADLAPGTQAVIMRGAAVVSGLFTGTIVGAVTGLVAWGVARLTRRA